MNSSPSSQQQSCLEVLDTLWVTSSLYLSALQLTHRLGLPFNSVSLLWASDQLSQRLALLGSSMAPRSHRVVATSPVKSVPLLKTQPPALAQVPRSRLPSARAGGCVLSNGTDLT